MVPIALSHAGLPLLASAATDYFTAHLCAFLADEGLIKPDAPLAHVIAQCEPAAADRSLVVRVLKKLSGLSRPTLFDHRPRLQWLLDLTQDHFPHWQLSRESLAELGAVLSTDIAGTKRASDALLNQFFAPLVALLRGSEEFFIGTQAPWEALALLEAGRETLDRLSPQSAWDRAFYGASIPLYQARLGLWNQASSGLWNLSADEPTAAYSACHGFIRLARLQREAGQPNSFVATTLKRAASKAAGMELRSRCSAFMEIAELWAAIGEPRPVEALYEEVRRLALGQGAKDGILEDLAISAVRVGQLELAREIVDGLWHFYNSDPVRRALALHWAAQKDLAAARQELEKIQEDCMKPLVELAVLEAMFEQDALAEAQRFFAMTQYKLMLGNAPLRASAYQALASFWSKAGDFPKAANFADRIESYDIKAQLYAQIARRQAERGQIRQALATHQEAVSAAGLAGIGGDARLSAQLLRELAGLYAVIGDRETVERIWRVALDRTRNNQHPLEGWLQTLKSAQGLASFDRETALQVQREVFAAIRTSKKPRDQALALLEIAVLIATGELTLLDKSLSYRSLPV